MISIYEKLEKFIGGMKFGISLILIFALALTVGTFIESYYGTEFANRLIYKSWPFMLLQGSMFICIFMATLLRFPAKKRLYGFYTLHAGLLLIFIGAFITWYNGIDGHLTLSPRSSSRQIILPNDELVVSIKENGKEQRFTYELPSVAYEKDLNINWNNITFSKYLPYSENETQWIASDAPQIYSVEYILQNDRFAERVILSLHSKSDFPSNTKMGPLSLHLMPPRLGDCFTLESVSGLIIWNFETQKCFTPEQRKIKIIKTKENTRFLAFKENNEIIKFFPDLAPVPLDDNFNPNSNLAYRIFSRKVFEGSPHVFIFGKSLAYFDKDLKSWISAKFEEDNKIELPWMGLQVVQKKYSEQEYPKSIPKYTLPIQDNGKMIKGEQRALLIEVDSSSHWLTSQGSLKLNYQNKQFEFALSKKSLNLPFELSLSAFKMNLDPGTNNPASYESFVNLFEESGSSKHHIYMNNPLKFDRFTFYQASYFQDEASSEYGSVLSVNYDPGRVAKYLGSLLLVLGSMWHFLFRKKTRS